MPSKPSITSLFLLILLTSITLAIPQPILKRQNTIPPTDPNPSSSSNETSSQQGGDNDNDQSSQIPIAVIIPVVVVLVVITLIVLFQFRSKLSLKFKSLSSSRNALQPISTRDSFPRTLTAEQLSGQNSRVDLTTDAINSSSTTRTTPSSTATNTNRTDAAAAARRNRRERERERNMRRTESGRSVKTLPVYSKEAGDEELVLVRQRSQSSFSSGSYSSDEEHGLREDAEGDAERGLLHSPRRSSSTRSSRTLTRDHLDSHPSTNHSLSPVGETQGNDELEEIELETRTPSTTSTLIQPPQTAMTSSPTPPDASTSTPQRSESLIRREDEARSWGLAPTYLEAMSSPSAYPDSGSGGSNAQVPPPMNLRTRTSSTFRGLLSRAGFTQQSSQSNLGGRPMRENRNSSTSLLLQPTTSRASSSFISSRTRSRSPSASASITNSPWESNASLLLISSPIPNTAVRASFDSSTLPKAGLSDEQMKFLSSKEAINLTGTRIHDEEGVPEYKRRRRGLSRSEGNQGDDVGRSRRGSTSTTLNYDRRNSSTSTTTPSSSPDNRDGIDGSSSQLDNDNEDGGVLPSWDMSENVRRQNEAFERRNLTKPPTHDPSTNSGMTDQDKAETQDSTIRPGPSSGNGSADLQVNQNTAEDAGTKSSKPIPPPIQVNLPSHQHQQLGGDEPNSSSSDNTFRTAPPTPVSPTTPTPTTGSQKTNPTKTNSTNLTITQTPRFEIEPPTPTIMTPPPERPL